MKSQQLIRLTATSIAGVMISLQAAAEETPAAHHHHYQLIKIGTFGGPLNYLHMDDYFNYVAYFAESQDLNDAETLVGYADTLTPDPYAPDDCFSDCYVTHAFVWRDGHMKDLGTLPHGPSSATTWVSANGLIAGASQNGELDPLSTPPGWPQNRAVLWRDGKIHDLGTLPEPEGGYESGAQAVNSRGQVVGWALNTIPDPYSMDALSQLYDYYQPPAEYYQMRAFIWQDNVMQDLGTLGTGNDAYAMAINEQGQVIGIAYTNTTPNEEAVTQCNYLNGVGSPIPTVDPFLWEHGKMTDLGTLGGTCGLPYWINNAGDVVGFSDLAGDQVFHAFLWTKTRGMQDLGTLGGSSSAAQMMNDAGQIVGGSHLADHPQDVQDAFLWDGSMHDLGAIDGCSYAWAINARGQVVGNAGNDCNDVGFLWEEGGPIVDLNMLVSSSSSITVIAALEINDRGEIAGAGTDANGNEYAILLIPCDDDHPGIEECDYAWVDSASLSRPSIGSKVTLSQPGVLHRGVAPNHRREALGLRSPHE